MKIICTDNFDRDNIDESEVCSNINERYGTRIVTLLNDSEHENSENFYKLVEDSYKLYYFEP